MHCQVRVLVTKLMLKWQRKETPTSCLAPLLTFMVYYEESKIRRDLLLVVIGFQDRILHLR